MNTPAALRLSRLQALCVVKSWGPSELSRQVGSGTPAHWSDLLRGKKSFGEKLARKIERSLDLKSGYLDEGTDETIPLMQLSPRTRRIAATLEALPQGTRRETIMEMTEKMLDISSRDPGPDGETNDK